MKLSDNELKNIVRSEIRQAASYIDSEQSGDRETALRYYMGEPFGDEIDGRSQVVSRDVMDTIEWILPTLLRIFTGADRVVEYKPSGPEDDAFCDQATDVANYILDKNEQFLLQYTWMKSALLQRIGVIKVMWETEKCVKTDEREGLADDEFMLYLSGLPENVKVLRHEERLIDLPDIDPMTGQPIQVLVHDIKVRWTEEEGELEICPVPPEEFLISQRARSISDAGFVGHRVLLTRSELMEQGYKRDVVDALPTYSSVDQTGESLARYDNMEGNDAADPSMEKVAITECYIKVDYDGDGIAEWRKITVGGDDGSGEILDNEPWPFDMVPFAVLSPVIMPHTFWGLSVADLVMDIQRIKSVLMRQMLDGLYLANNPRTEVVDGQVNLDDLLTNRPGGIVRVKAPGSMREISTQWVGAQSMPMLGYIDTVRTERTGVNPQGQGPDANSLQNQTATAFNGQLDMAKQRVELIARIFAETGYKQLFKLILRFITAYQDKAMTVRLRGKWVSVDPRGWNAEMDVGINVGLGTGNKDAMLGHLGMIAAKQEQILMQLGPNNPLVDVGKYAATLRKMVVNANIGDPDQFFKDPESGEAMPAQPPKPDPKMIEAQAKAQLDAAKMQMDAQAQQAKMQSDMALAQAKLDAEIQLKREQMAAEMALKREQMMMEAQLKAAGMAVTGMGDVRMGGQIG